MSILIFIYGHVIGSFLNVCIYRIPREESIAFPSSRCPSCGTRISWYDNIPLVSYLFLLGRCRSCKSRIRIQYPLVEVINGLSYLILYSYFGFSLDFIFYALIFSVLIVISFIDINEMLIPDILVFIVLFLGILHKLLNYLTYDISPGFLNSFGGLLIAGGLFFTIYLLSRGGMGDGDITLMAALGFILGTRLVFLSILLSFIIGAFVSIFLLLTRLKTRKDPIPFGPFIVIAFMITVLWGEDILYLYWSLIYS